MGVKTPEIRARRAVLFEEIAADALVYAKEHKASYPGDRSTVGKLLPVLGKVALDDITPQTIKSYLDSCADHKDVKLTVRYAHFAPAHKLAAVDRLAQYRQEQEKFEAHKEARFAPIAA